MPMSGMNFLSIQHSARSDLQCFCLSISSNESNQERQLRKKLKQADLSLFQAEKMSTRWKHGLWDCFDNFNMCVVSWMCPCYQFGKNASTLGESNVACGMAIMIPGINACSAAHLRDKLRAKKGIKGSYARDLLAWCFCPFCALLQETQEIEDRGPNDVKLDRQ